MALDESLGNIQGTDAAKEIGTLAGVAATGAQEIARAAIRAMWRIVRQSGRPGADEERKAMAQALAALLTDTTPEQLRRDVLCMLSEIGGEPEVSAIGALLGSEALREDARITLERIPVEAAKTALRQAFEGASDDFKNSLAESLRKRGEALPDVPSVKMVPTKATAVQPL